MPTPHQKAHVSRKTRWESLLDGGIKEIRILMDRLAKDGGDFLDGEPKELLHELYYLGNFQGAPVYGFSAGSKFFLIDAPGGTGLLAWVQSQLRQLGTKTAVPTAILLSSCNPEATAGLKELLTQTHSSVVAGSAGLEAIRGMCPPGTTLIAAEDLPARGWFPVRVVALRGRGLAPVAYSVTLNSKNVLFSGRIPIQSKTVMEQALVTEISRSRAAAIDYLIAVNQLSSLKPDLWLPAAIADDQNANIYDGEWQNIVNFNYRVGFHCARGRGLLPPSSAVARAAGDPMDDNCLRLAREFTGSTRETASLRGIDEVLGVRGRVGLAVFRAELDSLGESPDSAGELLRRIGSLELYEGCFAEAAASLRKSLESTSASSLSASDQGDVTALLALAAIKQCGLERANAFIQGVAQAPPLKSPEAETQTARSRRSAHSVSRDRAR